MPRLRTTARNSAHIYSQLDFIPRRAQTNWLKSKDRVSTVANLHTCISSFHQGSLSRALNVETDGTQLYGFTCTLASPVTNCIGRCCESLALTSTIDRVLVPGTQAL